MTRTSNRIAFGTKAQTLERLAPHLKSAHILPQFSFPVTDWRSNHQAVLDRLDAQAWSNEQRIVRSCAASEDCEHASLAGHFLSIGNVAGRAATAEAISAVIASYGDEPGDHHVLVQPMLADVVASGVLFTRNPNTGADYLVATIDRGTDTATVTSGRGEAETYYCWKHGSWPGDPLLGRLRTLAEELEALTGRSALDIEFAVDRQERLILFQVRPLVAVPGDGPDPVQLTLALRQIAEKVANGVRPHPYLHGTRTIYGVMPDWNPAEMIGLRPRPLALSFYRELITDSIWAYQRHNYGYKNLRSFPLLIEFHGLPYIDTRVSFNSFVPADIDESLAERLVNHYVNRLLASPALHDKVEFEIVFSCYTFDLQTRLADLAKAGFSAADRALLADSLRRLTNRIVDPEHGLWRGDLDRVEELKSRQRRLNSLDPISRAYWLLEDCKRYGTLPFAGLARAGFIAIQMLRSLQAVGVLKEDDVAAFMRSVDTVATTMGRDLRVLSKDAFLDKYGHLRPGTYDIRSPRYDEAPDLYFDWSRSVPSHNGPARESDERSFALSLSQLRRIDELLEQHELGFDVVGLFDFLEAAIRGREYSKFIFTRSVSDLLSLLANLGAEYGLSRDDMSFFDVRRIHDLHGGCAGIEECLRDSIAQGRANYGRTEGLVLPPLLADPDDIWSFRMPPSQPNFITRGRVSAPVWNIDQGASAPEAGAIAMIPSADPGYDWLFSRGIVGLVTAWGGANSHMAIRASELGLPAVIGAGETLFQSWRQAAILEIDCGCHQVRGLR